MHGPRLTTGRRKLASANAGFVIGDDGVAVIDTFGNEDAARQLLAIRRATCGLPGGHDPVSRFREIQVLSLPGHTGGDSVVVVPDAKVAFAGDLFWRNIVPNMIDGSTKPWIDTLDTLVKSTAADTFVSGHGEVRNAKDVAAFRGYLETLLTLVTTAQTQRRSGDALLDAVLPALAERYGQWDFFKGLVERSITDMDAELSGRKRIPEARTAHYRVTG